MPNEQDELGRILRSAQLRASFAEADEIDTEYLLTAILSNKSSSFVQELQRSINFPEISECFGSGRQLPLSSMAKLKIARAVEKCFLIWQHKQFIDAHLLAALIEEDNPNDPCFRFLGLWGIDVADLQKHVEIFLGLTSINRVPGSSLGATSPPKSTAVSRSNSQLIGANENDLTPKGEFKSEIKDWFADDSLDLLRYAQSTATSSIDVPDLLQARSR